MRTNKQIVRDLIGNSVDLVFKHIWQLWYLGVLIFLVFHLVMASASEDRHFVSHGPAVGLKRYPVVVRCLTSSKMHNVVKHLLVSCIPSSAKRYIAIPYITVQCSKRRFAMFVDVVSGVGIAHLNWNSNS